VLLARALTAISALLRCGDLIAMTLTNTARGNTYRRSTWGREDLFGGGDRDFKDLVVQVDFTSSSVNGWLAWKRPLGSIPFPSQTAGVGEKSPRMTRGRKSMSAKLCDIVATHAD